MEKRLVSVLVLSFVILIGWRMLSAALWPAPPKPITTTTLASAANADGKPTSTPSTDATAKETPAKEAAAKASDAPVIGPVIEEHEARTIEMTVGRRGEPGYYRAVFSNQGGALEELRTGNYFDRAGLSAADKQEWKHWAVLVSKLDTGPAPTRALALRTALSSRDLERTPLESALWTAQTLGTNERPEGVEFTLAPGTGVTFVKRFTFVPDVDEIRFDLSIKNDAKTEIAGARSFLLTPAAGVPNDSGDSFYKEPQAVAFSRASDPSAGPITELPHDSGDVRGAALRVASPVHFAGLYNKYFAVLLHASDDLSRPTLIGASWRGLRDESWARANPQNQDHAWRQIETDVDLQLVLPPVGETRTWRYVVYAGPKEKDAIEAAFPDHASLIENDLGFVSAVSKVLLFVLNAFHALTSSWGLAIILLTITVRVALFPINRRSQTAMARYQAKMKRIQPKIDEVKKRYEKDPSKLRQEQAKIMQEEGAFPPLGGCLPPLLQIPVFIGLFRAIGVSFDLRQASFMGWIQDLSLPDRLIEVNWNLPLLGHVPYINVLPPLMVVMWILQQRSMPMPTEEQARSMYKMMMWMPVVMGIFLYNYAAGLSLYMITQSLLGILEQKVIRKYWPVDDTEIAKPKKKGGFMQKLLEAQEQKVKQLEAQKRAKARR